MKVKNKYWVEQKMTGLRLISVLVILFVVGYSIEITAFANSLFSIVIKNETLRLLAAIFSGCAFAGCLYVITIHEKKKTDKKTFLPILTACLDGLLLLFILKIHESANIEQLIAKLYFSFFKAFVGYNLFRVFIQQNNATKTVIVQEYDQLEQVKSELKQTIYKTKQDHSQYKQDLANIKQELEKFEAWKCDGCMQYFPSHFAYNGHKKSCKDKINTVKNG